ncbi:MAG TPA: 3-oxoacyl-[acyl-carrier-protein] synthase III C-terminal domain-containing protein [Mycobacterium sp.]|nr:3-oxoacyl-[acyl-carrier-protein] synthase III C-terminal domain-containing protein [Mycobacterium sp.]
MGTVVDRLVVRESGWRHRHSALHLAVAAAKACLHRAGRAPSDVDLLINAGIYRDRNIGEPALAALIQQDIGANPEDPHDNAHGTFSFDIANGTCGVLTALQIADGFLRSHAIERALIVAGDADPGRRMSEHFPFAPVGAALLCHWSDDGYGLGHVQWENLPDEGASFSATVGLEDTRNMLRFAESGSADAQFAAAGARVARACLDEASLALSDVDVIAAAPARRGYREALAAHLGIPVERIAVAADEKAHTASLVAALERAVSQAPLDARVLIVAAGAGITAGAALYRKPPGTKSLRRA